MITAIATVAVYVEDQERSLAFWTEQVGFAVHVTSPMGPAGSWIEVGPPDGVSCLVLYPKAMMPDWAEREPEEPGGAPPADRPSVDGSEQKFYAGGVSDKSPIEWTDATWNPVTGCTQISPGCDRCYALRFAERFRGVPGHHYEQGFDLRLWPTRLALPLRWREPRRIFVNSMSDLFHEDIPDAFIRETFAVMEEADWHTFQVLTKRPRRMAEMAPTLPWPDHIWAGTSVELDRYTWRSNMCLKMVPAAVRFVSAEPLLGPLPSLELGHLHWVITGGESGPRHRVCDPAWVRDLRDRCVEQGVAFFLKQWGGRTPKAGGRLLDGRTWDEFPRVRDRVGA